MIKEKTIETADKEISSNNENEVTTESTAKDVNRGQKFEIEAGFLAKGLFAVLVPSMVDVITDVFSYKHFIEGDFYLKITNKSNGFENENCTLVSINRTQIFKSLVVNKDESIYLSIFGPSLIFDISSQSEGSCLRCMKKE